MMEMGHPDAKLRLPEYLDLPWEDEEGMVIRVMMNGKRGWIRQSTIRPHLLGLLIEYFSSQERAFMTFDFKPMCLTGINVVARQDGTCAVTIRAKTITAEHEFPEEWCLAGPEWWEQHYFNRW